MYKDVINNMLASKDMHEINTILLYNNYSSETKAQLLIKSAKKGHPLYFEMLKEGVQLLKTEVEPSLYIDLVIAVSYEKLELYDDAIMYYYKCLEMLPISAWSYAIEAMKWRTYMKKSSSNNKKKVEYGMLACNKFRIAGEVEKTEYLSEKWREAEIEIRRQINDT